MIENKVIRTINGGDNWHRVASIQTFSLDFVMGTDESVETPYITGMIGNIINSITNFFRNLFS